MLALVLVLALFVQRLPPASCHQSIAPILAPNDSNWQAFGHTLPVDGAAVSIKCAY